MEQPQPAPQIDHYNLIYLLPFFLRCIWRLFFLITYSLFSYLRKTIFLIGESWLFLTFLLAYLLRFIGRVVLFSPLFTTALFFQVSIFLMDLVVRFFSLTFSLLQAIGKATVTLLSWPKSTKTIPLTANSSSSQKVWFGRASFKERLIKPRVTVLFKKILHFPAILINRLFYNILLSYRLVRVHHPVKLFLTSHLLICLFLLMGLFYFKVLADLPSPSGLRQVKVASSTRIMDRHGKLLYNIYRDENRTFVRLNQLPTHVLLATIAIEDKDFFNHNGVSLRGILRAAKVNFFDKNDHRIQGGSTITQQLVKNLFLTPEKTIERKIKEMILALFMEVNFTKEEILELYLNEVNYGGTAYGIEEAARYYFGKSARFLSLAEAAMLAGLPEKPSLNSPFVNPDLAKLRQRIVLGLMAENGFIKKKEVEAAMREKLVFVPPASHLKAPHFVMMVKEALIKKFGKELVERGGLQVYTTLDLNLQTFVEKIVKENIAKIKNSHQVTNGAVLVTQSQSGEVLSLVGSVDYFDKEIRGNVNVVISPRQPGSAIKPVTYSYAFENGRHPGNTIEDSPVVYQIPGSETYAPVNYDGRFRGRVTLREALAQSLNVPAVKLLHSFGLNASQRLVDQGQKLGITTWNEPDRYGLSLTLGAAEVTMLDMTTVYGTIANMGIRKDPVLVRKVVDAQDNVLVDNTTGENFFSGFVRLAHASNDDIVSAGWQKGRRVLSKTAAYWLISILSDNKARLPAFGPYAKLEIPGHIVAVKTGTTNDFRDNWTIGFTPDYLVATWVGNTDNKPMNRNLVSGITGAAPIWNEIMSKLIKDLPNRVWAMPEEMVPVKVCAINGLLTCQYCPLTVTEYFASGSEPKQACNFEAPQTCAARKAQAEAEGKSPDEIKAILANCILPSPTPS